MEGAISPKVCVISLGCKTNQCDGEELARALAGHGFSVEAGLGSEISLHAPRSTLNDIYIVNTCTVTAAADAKARKLIRRLAKRNPQARIIVTGCYAERAREELSRLPRVAAVVPNSRKARLCEIVASFLPSGICKAGFAFTLSEAEGKPAPTSQAKACAYQRRGSYVPLGRSRAFVKIQDGCNHACAYCIVPSVRGPMRSKPTVEVMGEVSRLCNTGTREVVLCGIRLGAYGLDLGEETNLAGLLHTLRGVPLARLRLSSMEPLDICEELFGEFADHPSLCHHLHLPLQSGDDGVLAKMARGYGLSDYRQLVKRLRLIWPDLSLTTDIMVGFPGEEERAFENTLVALREFDFARVHVFRFSPRPGTPAAARENQVPEHIKRARLEAVQKLAEELFLRRAQRLRGEIVEVLIEQRNPLSGHWEGLTPHYLRVQIPSDCLSAEEIVRARITGAGKDWLTAELVA